MADPKKNYTRRDFIHLLGLAGAASLLASCGPVKQELQETQAMQSTKPLNPTDAVPPTEFMDGKPTVQAQPESRQSTQTPYPKEGAYLAVAHGVDAEEITMAAIQALGGMEKFVHSGQDVIIKPNICSDYYPYEYAATTNPFVIAALVKLCIGAGAKRVRVMDNPFGGSTESAYQKSGIAEAVQAAGGEMEVMNRNKFQVFSIPDGRDLREWEFYAPIIETDVVINVPIAKHHGLARLTLGGKNLLGVINRPSSMHSKLGQRIADLTSKIRPSLTVVDAVRILTRNGPTGGNLDDVKQTNQVIASHDIVAADTFAAGLFGLSASEIGYIQASADMGLGTMDLNSIKIEEFAV